MRLLDQCDHITRLLRIFAYSGNPLWGSQGARQGRRHEDPAGAPQANQRLLGPSKSSECTRATTRPSPAPETATERPFARSSSVTVAICSGVVYRLTRNTEDAQDVVQDTWLKAHAQLGRFEARANVRTWLTRIAINCAIDHLRVARRREPGYDPAAFEQEPTNAGSTPRTQSRTGWCSPARSAREWTRPCCA